MSETELIKIDGAAGEGGGQILRSSLSLSLITGKSLFITNIRAARKKPGLMAQHLTAVKAAARISKASVEGAYLGSRQLHFKPGNVQSGRYIFKIKTAGAATLVLQTVFVPLSLASSSSSVIITGGTHVQWSPCFDYLNFHWLPYLLEIGYDARMTLEQAGYYPKGGGRINSTIRPAVEINSIDLLNRGRLKRITGISAVSNLPTSIAERQKRQAQLRLLKLPWKGNNPNIRIKIERLRSIGKGTFIVILAEFEGGRSCFTSLGKLGKPAERVADDAVDELISFIDSNGTIDPYLADQLILPLSLASTPSRFITSCVTGHLLTNIDVTRAFLPIKIDVIGERDHPGKVYIEPK